MFEGLKRNRELQKNEKLIDDERYEIDENGNSIIDVGAEEYNDIFSYYSLNGYNVLDSEFNAFLEAKAESIPLKNNLALVFHIKNANEDKYLEIKNAVRDNYEREIHAINREMRKNSIFSLTMLGVGAGFLLLYILLTTFQANYILRLLAEIGAWIFLWEAVDSYFLQRNSLKVQRLKKYRLMRSNIKVKEFVKKVVRRIPRPPTKMKQNSTNRQPQKETITNKQIKLNTNPAIKHEKTKS